MTRPTKCPGNALQRTTGAGTEIQMDRSFQNQIYATCGDLQTRHVRNRSGLSQARANRVAALFFGEGTR